MNILFSILGILALVGGLTLFATAMKPTMPMAFNSLDLAGIPNCLTAGTFGAPIAGWPATADLSEPFEDANVVEVFVDTSGGDVTLTAAALVDSNGDPLQAGNVLKFLNVGGGGSIIFTDGNGITYSFANQEGEFLCLKAKIDAPAAAADFIVL